MELERGMLQDAVAEASDGLGTSQAFCVGAPEQVGEPFETESRAALTSALDEPVGVEEHPVPGLQLNGLDGGRSDLQPVEAERRPGCTSQLADHPAVADQDRWR